MHRQPPFLLASTHNPNQVGMHHNTLGNLSSNQAKLTQVQTLAFSSVSGNFAHNFLSTCTSLPSEEDESLVWRSLVYPPHGFEVDDIQNGDLSWRKL